MISSNDCGAAPSTFSNEPFSSGLPNRQMMMFAAAALRANFLAVNAARPAVTSSKKQTQIVSALSISVVIGVGGFLGMGEHDIAVTMDKLKFVEDPVRTSSTATTTRESTTGTATAPANTTTTTTTTARTDNANDWTPDHAVMSGTKEQLKAMPQFKYSDYN